MPSNLIEDPNTDMQFRAVVRKVIDKGERSFVVTSLESDSENPHISRFDSITFGLASWQGKSPPLAGQSVYLSGLVIFRQGWRAAVACPIEIKDDKTPHQQQQSERNDP